MEGCPSEGPVLLLGLSTGLARTLIETAPGGSDIRIAEADAYPGPALWLCGGGRRPRRRTADDVVVAIGRHQGVPPADLTLPETASKVSVREAVVLGLRALSAGVWREEAQRLHWYDPVTGRPRLALLHRHLQQLIRRARRLGIACGLMAVEVPELEAIRVVDGDGELDRWRRWLADRLATAAGPAAGLGVEGDARFHIVVPDLPSGDAGLFRLKTLAERLLASAAGPPGRGAPLALRVGCAVYPGQAGDAAALIRQSRAALAGTGSGRHPVRMADAAMVDQTGSGLERHLHALRAIEAEAWRWRFQPLTDRGGRVVGAEALLRPTALDLDAGSLFAAARAAGRVPALARRSRRHLWGPIGRLRARMGAGFRVAVNLAPEEPGPELVRELSDALAGEGMSPQDIVLELTEESAAEVHEEELAGLVAAGFDLALDDFGTGRSSLARLRASPFRILKLDRSFFRDIPASARDRRLVSAIRRMAAGLELRTVAEGVETEAQLRFVHEQGFDAVQGYFTGRPVGLERFMELYG